MKVPMRALNKLILASVIVLGIAGFGFCQDNLMLKGYHTLTIPKGSFLRGTLMSNISTEINQSGDRVWLLNPFNMYIGEVKVIPKGSIFEGTISSLEKAKKGQDGLLQVDLNKIVFPSGQELEINGVLTQKGSTIFGGGLTKREGLKKMPHYSENLKPYVQLIPEGERIMGKETKLITGNEYIIQLVDDINIILKDN